MSDGGRSLAIVAGILALLAPAPRLAAGDRAGEGMIEGEAKGRGEGEGEGEAKGRGEGEAKGEAKGEAEGKGADLALLRAIIDGPGKDGALVLEPLVFPTGSSRVLVTVAFTLGEDVAAEPAELDLHAGVFAAADPPVWSRRMPFTRAAGPGLRSFQIVLAPGSYRLAVAAVGRGGGAPLARALAALEVPSFDGSSLRLSSVVLTSSVEVDAGLKVTPGQVVDGLVVGNVRLGARPGNGVARDAAVEAFFMVTGAAPSPFGSLALAARYRVVRGGDEVKAFPPAMVEGTVHAQPIPLQGIPSGDYELEIAIEDTNTQSRHTARTAFQIEER